MGLASQFLGSEPLCFALGAIGFFMHTTLAHDGVDGMEISPLLFSHFLSPLCG